MRHASRDLYALAPAEVRGNRHHHVFTDLDELVRFKLNGFEGRSHVSHETPYLIEPVHAPVRTQRPREVEHEVRSRILERRLEVLAGVRPQERAGRLHVLLRHPPPRIPSPPSPRRLLWH